MGTQQAFLTLLFGFTACMSTKDNKKHSADDTARSVVLEQINQGHATRSVLYRSIENGLDKNCRLVSFFTSFVFPVGVIDRDADMLEDVLRVTLGPDDELVLMINSPGGDLLAAETDREYLSQL